MQNFQLAGRWDRLISFIKDADIVIADSYLADFELYEKISG